jgi:hypothetical protein
MQRSLAPYQLLMLLGYVLYDALYEVKHFHLIILIFPFLTHPMDDFTVFFRQFLWYL